MIETSLKLLGLRPRLISSSFLFTLKLSDPLDHLVHLDEGIIVVFSELLVQLEHLGTLFLLTSEFVFPYLFV